MKRLIALLMLSLALGAAGAKDAAPLAEDPAVEQRLVAAEATAAPSRLAITSRASSIANCDAATAN